MERIHEYFEKLEELFLENDKEAFKEIKEDIIHEIEERRAEGETEDSIIASLGRPEEISAAYYEDKRLDKAIKAEQDVIDRDELVQEYKLKRKEILAKRKKKVWAVISVTIKSILVLLTAFFLVVTFTYLLQEQTLVWGPVTSAFFFASLFLLLSNITFKKRYKWLIWFIGLFGLIGSISLLVTNHWFYSGKFFNETLSIEASSLEKMNITSNKPVDVSVIRIPNGEEPKIEIAGYLTKKDEKNLLKTTKDSIELTVGENGLFDWAENMKTAEIVLYLPEKLKQKHVAFQVNKGEVTLDHMDIESLSLSMNDGEFRITDVNSKKMTLRSQNADIYLRHFFSNITVDNKNGKSILTDGQGDIEVTSTTGLINISAITGSNVELSNEKGKNVVSSGTIQQLAVQNFEGTTIIDTQEGETKIENGSGKVVLTDIRDTLSISNTSGTIIINEQYPVEATINSDVGDVKWVQTIDTDLNFILSSNDGKVQNTFKNKEQASHQVKIHTNTGDIKVISNE